MQGLAPGPRGFLPAQLGVAEQQHQRMDNPPVLLPYGGAAKTRVRTDIIPNWPRQRPLHR